jgi:predicted exporter
MISAPMLQLANEAGESVLILTDGLQRGELLRSQLTRAEVRRQLLQLAATLSDAPDALRHRMPEIDWDGWRATRLALQTNGSTPDAAGQAAHDDALWFAVQSLVPATLSWLWVYRAEQPGLFTAWH